MDKNRIAGMMRAGSCAALLLLLAVCGYMGRRETAKPASVPVVYEALDADQLAFRTLAQTNARLLREREEALSVLESVIADPRSGEEAVSRALQKKTEIAAYMESEARLEHALAQLGVAGAAAISGSGAAAVFVPPAAGQEEKTRMQILDLAASLCGLSADAVKIILVKNE